MRKCCKIGKIWVRFVLIFLQKAVTKKIKKTKQGHQGYAENPSDTAVLTLAALWLTFSKRQKTRP